jgi:hypothetical protein
VNDAPTEIQAILLLCDAAQSVGGKLYILGGGWSQVMAPPGQPFPMAVAVKIAVPWTETNRQIAFRVHLIDSDGEQVAINDQPVEQGGTFELGRPPGIQPGTPLDAMLAVNLGNVSLPPNSYVWEIEIDGQARANAAFRVIDPTQRS